MSNEEIVRAWKDAEFRQRLSAEEQALLPEHPAGAIELTDEALQQAAGGTASDTQLHATFGCCASYFFPTACDHCTDNAVCGTVPVQN